MTENPFEKIINDLLQDKNLRGFSTKWANRMSKLTPMTCQTCIDKHGTIVSIKLAEISPKVGEHDRCKCEYVAMRTKRQALRQISENTVWIRIYCFSKSCLHII